MKNRVFRCIENKARGFVGFLRGELLVGFGAFATLIFCGHPLVGIGLGSVVMFLLSVLRHRDADRADYALVGARRLSHPVGLAAPGASERRARHRG